MVKTITIKETTYLKLRKVKKDDESFSDLFDRLTALTKPIDVLTKIRGSVNFSKKKKMINEIYAKRAEMR